VVPTLVHDGQPITESAVILYYLEDAFPQPPLMPAAPADRARVHMFNKLIDEYLNHSCMILTFGTAFRPRFLKMTPQERDGLFVVLRRLAAEGRYERLPARLPRPRTT